MGSNGASKSTVATLVIFWLRETLLGLQPVLSKLLSARFSGYLARAVSRGTIQGLPQKQDCSIREIRTYNFRIARTTALVKGDALSVVYEL